MNVHYIQALEGLREQRYDYPCLLATVGARHYRLELGHYGSRRYLFSWGTSLRDLEMAHFQYSTPFVTADIMEDLFEQAKKAGIDSVSVVPLDTWKTIWITHEG